MIDHAFVASFYESRNAEEGGGILTLLVVFKKQTAGEIKNE